MEERAVRASDGLNGGGKAVRRTIDRRGRREVIGGCDGAQLPQWETSDTFENACWRDLQRVLKAYRSGVTP